MKTKYKNPPINELVFGLYFDRHLLPFRSEHVGLFWGLVHKEFPVIRQQPAISLPMWGGGTIAIELIGGEGEAYPMPRFWLEGSDGSTVMQLQKNAFLFNWRKKDADYPHYEAVKAAFDQNFIRFTRFLDQEVQARPALQIAELTYVNVIASCEYWSGPQDTPNVFPNFHVVSTGTPQPDFNQVATQQVAPDLSLTTSIRNGRAQTGGKPMLIFEFRALGLLGAADKSEADAWFERAHEAIGDRFTATTNPDIQQRYWQPV